MRKVLHLLTTFITLLCKNQIKRRNLLKHTKLGIISSILQDILSLNCKNFNHKIGISKLIENLKHIGTGFLKNFGKFSSYNNSITSHNNSSPTLKMHIILNV